ncbi:9836_t:CDS:2, partial [Entrophospora sp. SA101]
PDFKEKTLVPLISGYTIFTSLSEYGTDHTFSHSNSSKLFDKFSDIKQYILDSNHINYKGGFSIPWLLGLTCTDNVQWLRACRIINKELQKNNNNSMNIIMEGVEVS